MIRVMLFLDRRGNSPIDEWVPLGRIDISNSVARTMNNPRRGDYEYEIYKKRRNIPWASGVIEDFPRQSYHPWNLIRRILNQVAEANGGTI